MPAQAGIPLGTGYVAPQDNLGATYPGPRAVDDPRNAPPIGAAPAAWQARDAASAAPQAPPGAELSPNQNYVDAFNSSLARQRQAIDSSLAASLGSMGHRRDLAAQTITKGSADVQQALANQQAFNTKAGQDADQGLVQGAAPGANANDNLYSQVINSAKSTETGAEPLLQLGAQANYDTGAAQLNSSALSARAAVDQQASQFAAQQASFQHDEQMAQLQSKLSNPDYNPANDATLQRQLYLEKNNPELLSSGTAAPYSATPQGQADAAAQHANIPGGGQTLQQLMQLPAYGWAERALGKQAGQKGTQGNGPTLAWSQVLGKVGASANGNLIINALYANGAITKQQWAAWGKHTAGGDTGASSSLG